MKRLEEEWRDILGYEGLYQVSNLGNVRSLDRIITQNNTQWGKSMERRIKWNVPCMHQKLRNM